MYVGKQHHSKSTALLKLHLLGDTRRIRWDPWCLNKHRQHMWRLAGVIKMPRGEEQEGGEDPDS